MDESVSRQIIEVLRNLHLSEEMVKTHVMLPDHIKNTVTGIESVSPTSAARRLFPFYRLDTEKFARDLHKLLSKCVVGYSMQLRRNGHTVLSQQWSHSKTSADAGGPIDWTPNVRMHVASVSKLITAMAMTRLLRDRNISPDTYIAEWLPDYWHIGHDADRITFRHLLTHTSGLNYGVEKWPTDFLSMKNNIAKGTTHLNEFWYQNINFGLCRILICTLNGAASTGLIVNPEYLNDQFWDIVSINAYQQYVNENIYAPSGVSAATLDDTGDKCLAYSFPVQGNGWNSGDLATASGGVGWHTSTDDLLDVMGTFRRQGRILSAPQANAMLENGFGLDFRKVTPLGPMYGKGGFWTDDDHGTHVEQSNAYFLPRDMELVVLCNSPFCQANRGFMNDVTRTIEDNIVLNRAVFAIAGIVLSVGALVAGAFWRAPR